MKIAIDVTPLKNENKNRGVGIYTQSLIDAMTKYQTENTYIFFTQGKVNLNQIDLVHYPYFDPFFLTLPLVKLKPVVVTVHDLIPLALPQYFPKGLKGEIKWKIQRASLSGSRRIITDSEASKVDIVSLVGIKSSRIDVVYLAPRENLFTIKESSLLDTVKKFGLNKRFILYVGDVNPNKNVIRLLQGFSYFQEKSKERMDLVLVGKSFLELSLKESLEIKKCIEELEIGEFVKKIGFITDGELAALYKQAAIYVQPSIMEGFGLPVLEAMAFGTVVVTSNTSSLKEIAGPAISVNPNDFKDIGDGILRGLKVNRKEWLIGAKRWTRKFSWQKVAFQTSDAYNKAFETKT